jgi:glycosyltransferase involved in cell wall biosynthesis
VIAYGRGGAAEIVTHEHTGLLYDRQDPDSLVAAVQDFESRGGEFSPAALRASAARFSAARFRSNFAAHLQAALNEDFVLETGYEPVPLLAEPFHLARE